ncbi:MAG: hypothetical protein Ct9H90mP13_09480 [Pseudomonadota bacterium]|nr:MAG: hypothetical protein Ct9H90mP13_09480 [Pseudomonadota bacterium]
MCVGAGYTGLLTALNLSERGYVSQFWKPTNWHGGLQDVTEDRLEVAITKRFMN